MLMLRLMLMVGVYTIERKLGFVCVLCDERLTDNAAAPPVFRAPCVPDDNDEDCV